MTETMQLVVKEQVKKFVSVPAKRHPYIQPGIDVCGIRSSGVWGKFSRNPFHGRLSFEGNTFQAGVMLNVRFMADFNPAGCGSNSVYTGHAIGDLVQDFYPKSRQFAQARRLHFNSCTGAFVDCETLRTIRACTALFLMPGCKARYIP